MAKMMMVVIVVVIIMVMVMQIWRVGPSSKVGGVGNSIRDDSGRGRAQVIMAPTTVIEYTSTQIGK